MLDVQRENVTAGRSTNNIPVLQPGLHPLVGPGKSKPLMFDVRVRANARLGASHTVAEDSSSSTAAAAAAAAAVQFERERRGVQKAQQKLAKLAFHAYVFRTLQTHIEEGLQHLRRRARVQVPLARVHREDVVIGEAVRRIAVNEHLLLGRVGDYWRHILRRLARQQRPHPNAHPDLSGLRHSRESTFPTPRSSPFFSPLQTPVSLLFALLSLEKTERKQRSAYQTKTNQNH